MDVYYDTIVSPSDRDVVERWISENNSDDIDYITIDEGIVSVHGNIDDFSGVTGTAPRQGDLGAELDAARDGMRRFGASPPRPAD
jgi:anti-sigma factor RsiW